MYEKVIASLHDYIMKEDLLSILLLLEKYPDVVKVEEDLIHSSSMTLLMNSSSRKMPQILHKIISLGANIDKEDSEGYTALIYAAKNSQVENIKILLSAGADINYKLDAEENTDALSICIEREIDTSALCLILAGIELHSSGKQWDSNPQRAVRKGKITLLKAMLENGLDVNDRDAAECSLLHSICMSSFLGSTIDCIDLLINAGIDIDGVNNSGDAALHYAVISENFECVKELVKNNANVYIKNHDGKRALDHLCKQKGPWEIEKLLMGDK